MLLWGNSPALCSSPPHISPKTIRGNTIRNLLPAVICWTIPASVFCHSTYIMNADSNSLLKDPFIVVIGRTNPHTPSPFTFLHIIIFHLALKLDTETKGHWIRCHVWKKFSCLKKLYYLIACFSSFSTRWFRHCSTKCIRCALFGCMYNFHETQVISQTNDSVQWLSRLKVTGQNS